MKHIHKEFDDGTTLGLLKDKLANRAIAQNNNIISQGEIQKHIIKELKIKKIRAIKPDEDAKYKVKLKYVTNKKGCDRQQQRINICNQVGAKSKSLMAREYESLMQKKMLDIARKSNEKAGNTTSQLALKLQKSN